MNKENAIEVRNMSKHFKVDYDKAHTLKEKLAEFCRFILARAFTMVVEIVGVFLLNDVIHSFYGLFSDNSAYLINKVIMTVIVIILNFFFSKFFAFKKNNKNTEIENKEIKK